jgi:hypothetical protein
LQRLVAMQDEDENQRAGEDQADDGLPRGARRRLIGSASGAFQRRPLGRRFAGDDLVSQASE